MSEDIEENIYPFISESKWGDYYEITDITKWETKRRGNGTIYRVNLNEDNGYFEVFVLIIINFLL